MHRNEVKRALGLSDIETDEIHEAWKGFPGRNTNDNIHPAFAYGWIAGRDYQRATLSRPAPDDDAALGI